MRDGVLSLLLNLSFHAEIQTELIKHDAIERISPLCSSSVLAIVIPR